MKKFLTAILLAIVLWPTDAEACIGISTHNYYIFEVLDGTFAKDRQITERCNQFWKDYTNNEVSNYLWNKETIMKIAQKRGDKEIVSYLQELNKYLNISDELADSWTYPTKQELAARQQTLQQMAAKAAAYKGKRLKAQWALLHMRANMVLKRHQTNIDFWNSTGSKMPQSVYREMMENIYAGALLHTGHRKAAIKLFSQQGDITSVKWLLRKTRNIDGIKSVYNDDPTSPSLIFLVQDFVNNAQETLDNTGESNIVDSEWMKTIDSRIISKADCEQFIRFAQQVIKEGKNPHPALWQAAIGELQFLNGDAKAAVKTLDKALTMKDNQRMLDNARVIRIVAAVKAKGKDKKFAKWMSGELNWLIAKGNEAQKSSNNSETAYHRAMERLIFMELVPMYKAQGNYFMQTALLDVADNTNALWSGVKSNSEETGWNINYSDWSGFSDALDQLSGNQLVAYAQWIQKSPADEMEQFVKQRTDKDPTYFNDMAGTHYIAEGKFKEAIPLLQQIPLKFMEGQNISFYLAHRDYTKGRWFGRQSFGRTVQTEGPRLAKLTHNPKLAFCEEILQLQTQYNLATGNERAKLALQLARRYYQVSHNGDCWYITHYGHSWGDKASEKEMDFVEEARQLLRESSTSTDFATRQESLFALAFIPTDPTGESGWFDSKTSWANIATNRNQQDLAALHAFYLQNKGRVAYYVTKCDVLKCFSSSD